MDSIRFAALARSRHAVPAFTTRRTALTLTLGGMMGGLSWFDAKAKKKRKKRKKMCKKIQQPTNPCAGQNWCVDRTQTCGRAGGFGRCLVEVFGGNICAGILFQVDTCAECEPASCTNCRCVLAAGGGDRCSAGPNGKEFLCVRPV